MNLKKVLILLPVVLMGLYVLGFIYFFVRVADSREPVRVLSIYHPRGLVTDQLYGKDIYNSKAYNHLFGIYELRSLGSAGDYQVAYAGDFHHFIYRDTEKYRSGVSYEDSVTTLNLSAWSYGKGYHLKCGVLGGDDWADRCLFISGSAE